MTWLEVLVNILAGASYVPRTKGPLPPDRAEGHSWILGAVILVAVIMYVLIKITVD